VVSGTSPGKYRTKGVVFFARDKPGEFPMKWPTEGLLGTRSRRVCKRIQSPERDKGRAMGNSIGNNQRVATS
jgi:hypothetical protein